ncbi:hypothetical protein, partial [Streptomyces sp. NPDC005385]|uniref:hypothetical protein n=1 Tax=Streptomyces sp. NPDC005385 TaxID=3157039 RepID=UPI0033A418B4
FSTPPKPFTHTAQKWGHRKPFPRGQNIPSKTHVHLKVEGHVLTERKLVALVQEGIAKVGARNSSTYPPYKR